MGIALDILSDIVTKEGQSTAQKRLHKNCPHFTQPQFEY